MISVNNLAGHKVSAVFLKKVAKIVLSGENIEKEKELSVVLVKPATIKKLNQKYRKKNQPTDVLSFEGDIKFGILGEVVICPQEVKKNAGKNKTVEKKELAFVLIHGILHLLGYCHEGSGKEAKIMDKKTKNYLLKVNL